MAKLCPECKTENEKAVFSCQCGFVFVNEIEQAESSGLAALRDLRRKRIFRTLATVMSAVAILAVSAAAYFGAFFWTPMVADNDRDSRSLLVGPAARDVSQTTLPKIIFPEKNVPYKVTRAFTGAAVGVTDSNNVEHRVTLHGIRVPKLDENFGRESKEHLENLVTGKSVMIKPRAFTKEAETIAEVVCEGSNIGLEQVRQGMAWLAVDEIAGLSDDERGQYLGAAVIAKTGRFGVWSDKQAVDPATIQIAEIPGGTENAQTAATNSPILRTQRPAERRIGRSAESTTGTVEAEFTPPAVIAEADKPSPPASVATVANDPAPTEPPKAATAPKSGRNYTRGPLGGCFYINSSGTKSYVDRSACN